MNITFLTEMNFEGKISSNYPDMRTEFAWMNALDANHSCIYDYNNIKNQDHVFIIFPKGQLNLNAVAAKLTDTPNPHSELLDSNWLSVLKRNNKKIYYIQEGPSWMFTELEIQDQFNFYNMLTSVDAIYTHNDYDQKFYKGLVPTQTVLTIPTLMIEDRLNNFEIHYTI